MDEWETIVEGYQESSDPKDFAKVLKSADIIFGKDLASFEIDWILSTLLQKPINLLNIVSEKRTSDDWSKCIVNSLKLLNCIITKYECANKYYEDIVTLCLLPYDAQTRQQALSCLASLVSRSSLGARDFDQHLLAFQSATTCKAPLAILIGAICEHHPDIVEAEMTSIWRVFLHYLDFNKNTETVIKAVLEGIMGLFKHFEMELPTMELNIFYDKLITYLDLPKCEKTVLQLLQRHAAVFRERVRGDARVRGRLWARAHDGAGHVRAALRATYLAVADVAGDDDLKAIITAEVEPHTKSRQYYEKFTALYILSDIHNLKGFGDLNEYVDIQALEFDVRSGNINYETCEAISWCIQANILFSDRLLQTAILFYDKFISLKRTEVIINTFLQAEKDVRTAAVIFLISETCRSAQQQYTQLWHDLLDTNNNNPIVLEHAPFIVDDVLEYMFGMLEGLEDEEFPPRLYPQLSVLALVLRTHVRPHAPLARLLSRVSVSGVQTVPVAVLCALSTGITYENISIQQCVDDEDKLQCALALIDIPDENPYSDSEMITALEIVFSRNDTEASVLSKSLTKLENVIQKQGLYETRLNDIIRKIESRSRRIDRQKKSERILYRDIIMFLGKYSRRDMNQTTNFENFYIARLENKLLIELPYRNTTLERYRTGNPTGGHREWREHKSFRAPSGTNLKEICYSAIECEDVEACKTLCAVICANLAKKKDVTLQHVLIRVLVCLSHCAVNITYILTAVSMCDAVCANELIKWIIREKSTRSRRILLEALEVLLQLETDGPLQQNVLRNIILYEDESKKQAILDIIDKLLEILKGNNLLCQVYLPDVLIKVFKSGNTNLTKTATDIFTDKIELYDRDTLNKTTDNIFKVLNGMKNKMADALIKMAVEFVKNIFEIKKDDRCIMNYYFSVSDEINLTVLVKLEQMYRIDFESKILNDCMLNKLFCCDYFDEDNAIFDFIAEYADVLMDSQCENTYNLLSRAIEKLTPERIIETDTKLSKCLSSLKKTKKYEPILIKTSFETILTKFPIKDISESIGKYSFETKHEVFVNALNVVLNSYDGPILMEFSRLIKQWFGWIMKLNSTGHVERSLKSKMAYLYDLVSVSMMFFEDEEILDLILKEDDKSGVSFLSSFMPVTYKYLVKKPYTLLLAGLKQCCSLLNDVVRYTVRRNRGGDVVELVDVLWPTYKTISTFDQKYSLLLDLMVMKLPASSNPMQWVVTTIKEGNLVEKIKLVVLLPADEYDVRSTLAPHLPALRELRAVTSCAFRAVLDALAQQPQHEQQQQHDQFGLLELVAALVEGDDTRGWWDDAIDMCMCRVAQRADMRVLRRVHARCVRGRARACERLLRPLLRYTKPSLCEEFMSSILDDLLSVLKMTPRSVVNHYSYEKCVMDYVRALNVIQIIFDKVPKENIDSPRSVLYSKMSDKVGDTPFYLISTVCKLCFTLRSKVLCPKGANESMVKTCRSFHCVSYNCLVTAILLRDPNPRVYATVFDASHWHQLIGDEPIDLPIREQWRQRVSRHAAPASLCELRTRTLTRSAARTRTRTRMFTRTLSENPLAYDLVQEDEQIEPQELELADNPLNRHPCAGALCALLAVSGARGPELWRAALGGALRQGKASVRWLLAQAICNSREELRPHASALQPALLAVIRDTATDGKLNGLHVDILDTLILWQEDASENTDLVIDYIINTAIDNRHRANVYWTLVDKLAKLLGIWKEVRPNWTCFEKYFVDPKADTAKVCLSILKRITKCEIHIPELSNALMEAMEAKKFMIEIYELFGLVLAIDNKRDCYIKRYLKVLERLRKSDIAEYVKMLYYVQKGYPQICDESNFRSIIDLTPKITTREKLKCLEILSTYVLTATSRDDVVSLFDTVGLGENLHTIEGLKLMRNGLHLMNDESRKLYVLQVADSCRRLSEKLRLVAYEILIKALELLIPSYTSEPQSKRRALETSSLILGEKDGYTRAVLEGVARGVGEGRGEMRSVREGAGRLLDEDLDVRFCECFYLAVLNQSEYEVNPATIIDLFFQGLKDDKLKSTKLRDEPIEVGETTSSIISRLSVSLKQEESISESVNVQMTLEEVFDSLLKFSERNSNAAISLLIQLLKAHQTSRPRFSFSSTVGPVMVQALCGRAAQWAAPVARGGAVGNWEGMSCAIDKLLEITRGSEDEVMCKLVKEDYKIKCESPSQFILSDFYFPKYEKPQVSQKFSIKDLISTFGQLSNWDNLTIQKKSNIKIGLPPLWTSRENIKMYFEDFDVTDAPIWMKCMLSSSKDFDDNKYLKDVDKWPRKLFDISAVTETPILKSIRDGIDMKDVYLRSDIPPSDCMAEWAARIMIRSMYLEPCQLSRSHQLAWCTRASEMGLHEQVLECCKTVVTDLYESETLKWFRQRVLALRAIALVKNDTDSLRNTLNLAVTYTPQFIEKSSFGDVLGMNEAILTLRRDLKSLNKDHVESALQDIKYKLLQKSNDIYDKKVMESVCVLSLTFYDQLWETSAGVSDQNDLLLNMSQVLGLIVDLDLGPKSLSADVIINRLDLFVGDEMGDEVAEHLLDRLLLIVQNLDTISLEHLKSKIDLFKKYKDHETMKYLKENEGILKYKMCLKLVGDAEHLLLQYCSQILKVLDDKMEWSKIFDQLKNNIFGNPYAGPDYQVLDKYKTKLYDIAEFDSTDTETKKRVLLTVHSELKMAKRESVSLSHVCPALSVKEIEDDSLNKLLCLKPGVNVFKFEEKIPIFVDSIRRPAVLTVRLSDGSVRRYIVKRGEQVRTHCAAMRLLATVQGEKITCTGYNVTQLSDDCALIEYLEDHERFRTLIASRFPIDDAVNTDISKDSELILAPSRSLNDFLGLCSRIPAYVLRYAVEDRCASVQDYISKKSNYLEALCSMTIFSYLFGVGDRHLENLMYSLRDGRVCPVDCGAILQYGGTELLPARLTRNVLALCDTEVVESRLQSITRTLRESSGLILPSISVIFKWMGQIYMKKLPRINDLVQGKSLSLIVTIDAVLESDLPYQHIYLQLLEEILGDFEKRKIYSVEEQVAILLRQCTAPSLLSVTRSGWEPWI